MRHSLGTVELTVTRHTTVLLSDSESFCLFSLSDLEEDLLEEDWPSGKKVR